MNIVLVGGLALGAFYVVDKLLTASGLRRGRTHSVQSLDASPLVPNENPTTSYGHTDSPPASHEASPLDHGASGDGGSDSGT